MPSKRELERRLEAAEAQNREMRKELVTLSGGRGFKPDPIAYLSTAIWYRILDQPYRGTKGAIEDILDALRGLYRGGTLSDQDVREFFGMKEQDND